MDNGLGDRSLEAQVDTVLSSGDKASVQAMIDKVVRVQEFLYPHVSRAKDGTFRGRRGKPKDARAYLDAVGLESKLRGFLTGGMATSTGVVETEIDEEIRVAASKLDARLILQGGCENCKYRLGESPSGRPTLLAKGCP